MEDWYIDGHMFNGIRNRFYEDYLSGTAASYITVHLGFGKGRDACAK